MKQGCKFCGLFSKIRCSIKLDFLNIDWWQFKCITGSKEWLIGE
jgi:hypothetical protein